MSKPLVSVIISVFNGEKYLPQAIESILNQTLTNFELIIVNDNSTDSTLEVLQDYKDDRIKVITNDQNIGTYPSANKALKIATGDYIARLDADDISYPNRLQEQYDFIQDKGEAIVGSWAKIINQHGTEIGKWGAHQYLPLPDQNVVRAIFGSPVIHSASFMSRELLNKLGGYSEQERRVMDYDLWTRAIAAGVKIYSLSQYLIARRTHAENMTSNYNTDQERISAMILKRYLNKVFGLNISGDQAKLIRLGLNTSNQISMSFSQKTELLGILKHIKAAVEKKFTNKQTRQIFSDYVNQIKQNRFAGIIDKIIFKAYYGNL
jgi:glycosyltransferase involved in cell wall biosynthesis